MTAQQTAHREEIDAHALQAAPEMLEALRAAHCPCWVHNAAITDDIEALRRIALFYADWSNGQRLSAMEKAAGV